MGDDRSTVDSILDGLEILDEDGPRLIERAFGDEIPSCMDDFADPDDSMWRNGDGRDVLWDLLLDHPLLDPMHGIALDPYVADSEHPDVIIRLFDTSFVDDLSGRGAVARIPVDDGHMDALVAMCERIAHDGRWVASGTDPRETLRRCEEVVRRCQRIEREVNDWEANARKRGQRDPAGNDAGGHRLRRPLGRRRDHLWHGPEDSQARLATGRPDRSHLATLVCPPLAFCDDYPS